ncbi:hypothetical protein H4219_000029 [Mycoemilia scoparia]|uniref:Dilute domain-containing protein n=1 Tax=Mycoemilia scoparia TaxID=417184 RepID=A0A9W8DX00_9FUNG|nr:hypothetical protein H4219_000029 [Mycoemilia scoparia]
MSVAEASAPIKPIVSTSLRNSNEGNRDVENVCTIEEEGSEVAAGSDNQRETASQQHGTNSIYNSIEGSSSIAQLDSIGSDKDELSEEYLANLLKSSDIEVDQKKAKVTEILCRAASSGYLQSIKTILGMCKDVDWVDIDGRDSDGSTPLICAACMGHCDVARAILEHGASVDAKDMLGWTALMWAANSGKKELVELLIRHGASPDARTSRGFTAKNIATASLKPSNPQSTASPSRSRARTPSNGKRSDAKSDDMLPSNVDSVSTRARSNSTFSKTMSSKSSSSPSDNDDSLPSDYGSCDENSDADTQSVNEDKDGIIGLLETRNKDTEPSKITSQTTSQDAQPQNAADREGPQGEITRSSFENPTINASASIKTTGDATNSATTNDAHGQDGMDNKEHNGQMPFSWDELELDQMLVVSKTHLTNFLNKTIKNMEWEHAGGPASIENRYMSSNLLFLAGRFFFFNGMQSFEEFWEEANVRFRQVLQLRQHDVRMLGYWTTNLCMLIYYLNRDGQLRDPSLQYIKSLQSNVQACLHSHIHTAYNLIISSIDNELSEWFDQAILDYSSIPEILANVQFKDTQTSKLSRFFQTKPKRSSFRTSIDGRPLQRVISPAKPDRKESVFSQLSSRISTSNTMVPDSRKSDFEVTKSANHRPSYHSDASFRASTSSMASVSNHTNSTSAGVFERPSPKTIIYIFDHVLTCLRETGVHPQIVYRIVCHMIYFTCTELFNRIMTTREFCNRSHAMAILMNWNEIDEWINTNKALIDIPPELSTQTSSDPKDISLISEPPDIGPTFPILTNKSAKQDERHEQEKKNTSILSFLHTVREPLIELLQFLQCITNCSDLMSYLDLKRSFKCLNDLQVSVVVENYRYEVDEPKLDDEVEQYINDVSKTIRDQQVEALKSGRLNNTAGQHQSTRSSMSFEGGARSQNSVELPRTAIGGSFRFSGDNINPSSRISMQGVFSKPPVGQSAPRSTIHQVSEGTVRGRRCRALTTTTSPVATASDRTSIPLAPLSPNGLLHSPPSRCSDDFGTVPISARLSNNVSLTSSFEKSLNLNTTSPPNTNEVKGRPLSISSSSMLLQSAFDPTNTCSSSSILSPVSFHLEPQRCANITNQPTTAHISSQQSSGRNSPNRQSLVMRELLDTKHISPLKLPPVRSILAWWKILERSDEDARSRYYINDQEPIPSIPEDLLEQLEAR